MIRYEILSNVASSESGLQDHVELQDLVDSCRALGLDARVVRQVAREEEEINIASQQFARGVKVRSRAVREIRPETSLKGSLNWLRGTASRVDRGIHLELDSSQASNGVALVLGQVYARNQLAFVTGIDDDVWHRLTAVPDITLQALPKGLEQAPAVRRKFMERRERVTSFSTALDQLARLDFLPEARRTVYEDIVRNRKTDELKAFSEAEVVNLGMIYEGLQRYQGIFAQFFQQVYHTENVAELATMFELLCQGISLVELKQRFAKYALELKRDRISTKRNLINEIRIAFSKKPDDAARAEFERQLTAIVLRQRLQLDPPLYAKLVRLPKTMPEEQQISAQMRVLLADMLPELHEFEQTGPSPESPISMALKLKLFSMVVSLNFLCEYSREFRGGVPGGPTFARGLLSCFSFRVFDVGQLRKLNPKLPVAGVAKNLADKIPVTWTELQGIHQALRDIVFPLQELLEELAGTIHAHYRNEADQRRTRDLHSYLTGSYPLIANSNYLLGFNGLTPVLRESMAAAGQSLGLTMVTGRDQVRATRGELATDEGLQIEGYLNLMHRETDKLLPFQAHPHTIQRAYSFLTIQRVATLVRRFVHNKLNQLAERYAEHLFEEIYQHLVWDNRLLLSRRQVGNILITQKVFDPDRLRQIGFVLEEMANADERANPYFMLKPEAALENGGHPMEHKRLAAQMQAAAKALEAFVAGLRRGDGGKGPPDVPSVLGSLFQENVIDPQAPDFQEALSGSSAAEAMWSALEAGIRQHAEQVLQGVEAAEAVEFTLPGPLAYLALLKPEHTLEIEETAYLFRARPRWDESSGDLDGRSRLLATNLLEQVRGSSGPLREAQQALEGYHTAWRALILVQGVVLLDVVLRETVLTLIRPRKPLVRDLKGYPEDSVMCLGMSSLDQGKFSRVIKHPERREAYATISELASWLARFARLRGENGDHRAIIADIRAIIHSFNFSVFDAPYITQLDREFGGLDEQLAVPPEEVTLVTLEQLQAQARKVARMLRDIHDRETGVAFRDRWLSRIVIRLRAIRNDAKLNFVDHLFEGRIAESAAEDEPGQGGEATAQPGSEKKQEFQTYTDRVRNVIESRELLSGKAAFVFSPINTQARLTLSVMDQLFRLRGLFVPIFVDISGCGAFEDQLRRRLPPHRLFDMNAL